MYFLSISFSCYSYSKQAMAHVLLTCTTPHSRMRLCLKFRNPGSEFGGTRHTGMNYVFYSDLLAFPDLTADLHVRQLQSHNMSNVKPDIVDFASRGSRVTFGSILDLLR